MGFLTEVQIFASSFANEVEADAHNPNDANKKEFRILLECVTACVICIAACVIVSRIRICDAWRCASVLTEVDGCATCVSSGVVCAARVVCAAGVVCAARVVSAVTGSTVAARTAVPSSGSIVLWQRDFIRRAVAISVHSNGVVIVEFA